MNMREILFRGKRVDNGEWVEGYVVNASWYLDDTKYTVILPTDVTLYPHSEFDSYDVVDPKTVGQFTGLLDKNGKKIFEGDIIDLPHWYVAYAGDLRESTGMNAGWYVQRDGFESWTELECTEDNEVIGNIHDNPELLTS
jgi:uncharacterized phage protein (TIGR01671 family)